jgi:hypothetical protein
MLLAFDADEHEPNKAYSYNWHRTCRTCSSQSSFGHKSSQIWRMGCQILRGQGKSGRHLVSFKDLAFIMHNDSDRDFQESSRTSTRSAIDTTVQFNVHQYPSFRFDNHSVSQLQNITSTIHSWPLPVILSLPPHQSFHQLRLFGCI